jgi:hypothetical protein
VLKNTKGEEVIVSEKKETTTKEPKIEVIEETQQESGEMDTNIDMKTVGSGYVLH